MSAALPLSLERTRKWISVCAVRSGAGMLLVVSSGVIGCSEGGHPGEQVATDTDGVVTTGVDSGDGGADGGGETGVQEPYYCIYNGDNGNLAGVKHQCSLEYDLDITFTVSLAGGSSFQVPLAVTAVQTASEESTYEHPFVMACCTDIRDAPGWPFADSCDTLHHEACMSDFIQHVCQAPGNWLEATADDFLGQGKEAIEAAAKWLDEHRQECYDHFWLGPDLLPDADYCGAQFDGFFEHTPWEPSETFQYVLPLTNVVLAEVSQIIVAPRSAFGQNVPLEPPTPAEACSHPGSNDGEVPPLSSWGPTGGSLVPVAPAPIEFEGPELGEALVLGAGEVGTGSALQWSVGDAGARRLERWVMTEAAATIVATSSAVAGVDHFKVALVRPVSAKAHDSGWIIEPDAARFVLGATIDGQGFSVQAANATSIELRPINGGKGLCPAQAEACVESGSFTIGYEDQADQPWMLRVPKLTWQP